MSKYKVIKSVSFNVKNADDRLCMEQINGINFSGYIKGLILADVKRQKMGIQRSKNGGIKYVVN